MLIAILLELGIEIINQSEARARRVPALEAGGWWAEHHTLTNYVALV